MKNLKNLRYYQKGFTLVELLVVMAILGILTVITLGNFRTSQIKARDAQRKSDLKQITNALEAYFSDHAGYPEASVVQGGYIKGCGCVSPGSSCTWDEEPGEREFCDENKTVYMSKVPGDPTGDPHYCYKSNKNYFQIYAKLENNKDSECLEHDVNGNCVLPANNNCNNTKYNFGISSSNCKPEEADPETNCQ